jgi:hypothetical protein
MQALYLPAPAFLNGFDWVIGAVLGGAVYAGLMARRA